MKLGSIISDYFQERAARIAADKRSAAIRQLPPDIIVAYENGKFGSDIGNAIAAHQALMRSEQEALMRSKQDKTGGLTVLKIG